MPARADTFARELNAQRDAFKAFLTARVGRVVDTLKPQPEELLRRVQPWGGPPVGSGRLPSELDRVKIH